MGARRRARQPRAKRLRQFSGRLHTRSKPQRSSKPNCRNCQRLSRWAQDVESTVDFLSAGVLISTGMVLSAAMESPLDSRVQLDLADFVGRIAMRRPDGASQSLAAHQSGHHETLHALAMGRPGQLLTVESTDPTSDMVRELPRSDRVDREQQEMMARVGA